MIHSLPHNQKHQILLILNSSSKCRHIVIYTCLLFKLFSFNRLHVHVEYTQPNLNTMKFGQETNHFILRISFPKIMHK